MPPIVYRYYRKTIASIIDKSRRKHVNRRPVPERCSPWAGVDRAGCGSLFTTGASRTLSGPGRLARAPLTGCASFHQWAASRKFLYFSRSRSPW